MLINCGQALNVLNNDYIVSVAQRLKDHQKFIGMMTSSNRNIPRHWLFVRVIHRWPLALYGGNPSVTGRFPSQRTVARSFDVFFDLCLNKRLSKQSRRRQFETPSHPLWRHCNGRETCNTIWCSRDGIITCIYCVISYFYHRLYVLPN